MSVLFSASDDIIDVGSPSVLNNIWDGGGTAIIWFNAVDFGGNGEGRFYQKGAYIFFLNTANDTIQLLINFSGGNARWEMPANLMVGNFNEWHLAAVTYNADSTANDAIFYFDGVLVSTVEIAAPSGTRTSDAGGDLGIGNRPGSLSRQMNGSLEDARLYNRILSASEILAIYNTQGADSIVNGLAGRWPMNNFVEGATIPVAVDNIVDISSNKNHGSVTDGTLEGDEIVAGRRRMAA